MRIPRTLTDYDAQKVGALVRHMRKVAGLTREQLGAALGLDPSSITRMEGGTRHRISLEQLMQVAHVCNLELRLTIQQK